MLTKVLTSRIPNETLRFKSTALVSPPKKNKNKKIHNSLTID